MRAAGAAEGCDLWWFVQSIHTFAQLLQRVRRFRSFLFGIDRHSFG
jgi:hypothetical protein